ncbi:hypothetical protein HRbin18_00396 [bacterium HR18]|nr:hypothetical protein HRbin18_00396 [bacterium HR18]
MKRCLLCIAGIWPLILQAQSLPLTRTLYRVEVQQGSYNCNLTEGGKPYNCREYTPVPFNWMELRWNSQRQAYELYVPRIVNNAYTTIPTGLYVDTECRFIRESWDAMHQSYCQGAAPFGGCSFYDPFLYAWPLYLFYCPYDPGQQTPWIVWLADPIYPINLGPQQLQRALVDFDPDRDGIANEPGYPYTSSSSTLSLYLVVYHHDKPDLKYAAIVTHTEYMRWLDVLLFQVHAEGSSLNPVSVEPLAEETPPLALYPHPAKEVLHIAFPLQTPATVSLTLYDLLGRPVYEAPPRPYPPGTHQLAIPRGVWPAGLYLLRLKLGSRQLTRTVLWE